MGLHHLHHDAHGAGHVAGHDGWGVGESLGQSNFSNAFFKLLFEPDAEAGDVGLRNAASLNGIHLRLVPKILLNLVKGRLDGDELLSLVLGSLLEENLIDVVGQDEHVEIGTLEWLHVG